MLFTGINFICFRKFIVKYFLNIVVHTEKGNVNNAHWYSQQKNIV